jgi:hypothetical protein
MMREKGYEGLFVGLLKCKPGGSRRARSDQPFMVTDQG